MIKISDLSANSESVEGTHYVDKKSKCGRYLRIMDTESFDVFNMKLSTLKRGVISGKYTEHDDGSFTINSEKAEIEFD